MTQQNYLIIGGSHGIGLGIVKRLIQNDNHVTVISRTREQLEGIDHVSHIAADIISDEISRDQLPSEIHGMVYCPGSINLGPLRGVKASAMLEDFQLNVVGAVTTVQAALPALKAADHSSIVFFSTVAVSQGLPMHTSVAASKGGVEAITRTMAAELAPSIRVNCVAPALTDTPLSETFLSDDKKRTAMAERYPLKRYGQVDDIAAMAEFLLSPVSGWITGQVIGVDGGMSKVRA